MKRVWKLCVCLMLLFVLGGCGNNSQTSSDTEAETQASRKIGIVVEAEGLEAKGESLKAAMAAWTDAEVVIVTSREEADDCIVIGAVGSGLIGGVREKDYAISFDEGEVTIEGGTKENAEKAVDVLISDYLPAWTDETMFSGEPEDLWYGGLKYRIRYMEIQGEKLWDYVIVKGDNEAAAETLQRLIEDASTYTLPIISADELTEGTPAFVFGSSKAREAESYSGLSEGECWMVGKGSDIYFCAGDAEDEMIAMKMFIAKYLDYDYYSGIATNSTVIIEEDFSLKFDVDFDGTEGWETVISRVAKVEQQGNWAVQQGGCSDGTYAYYILSNQFSSTQSGKIVKFDMSDWSVVAVSDQLDTDHSNDLTYNTKTNKIVAVHNKPNYTTLSIIDPETLTVDYDVDIGVAVYSIGYSEVLDQYICGQSGTHSTFAILDSEFKLVEMAYGTHSTLYTNQGCYADENYVYSFRSGSQNNIPDNYIFVNDWEGNIVAEILVDLPTEAENIFRVGNMWYTGYYSSGGIVYETIMYKVIE